MSPTSGILLVDKPQGMTSHDVVARVRRAAATRKVGHAGTLDPMATGLLILGIGSATRLLTHLVGVGKRYTATIRLGQATTTDDAEGEVTAAAGATGLTDGATAGGIAALTGAIEQVPSTVSAIKVAGKRAYALARAGEQVELTARPVTIDEFTLTARRDTVAADGTRVVDLDVAVRCSSGTYVRALARDLGAGLGVGGHLTALRRTQAGPFDVADAARLDDPHLAAHAMTPAAAATRLLPTLPLDENEAVDLGHGKRIAAAARADGGYAAIAPGGRLVAIVEIAGGTARVRVGFPPDKAEDVGAPAPGEGRG